MCQGTAPCLTTEYIHAGMRQQTRNYPLLAEPTLTLILRKYCIKVVETRVRTGMREVVLRRSGRPRINSICRSPRYYPSVTSVARGSHVGVGDDTSAESSLFVYRGVQ